MSVGNVNTVNNNGVVAKANIDTSMVKIFEVTTNVNEIITIKKEPLDFVEYTGSNALDASVNPLLELKDKPSVASSSNVSVEEGVTVSYQIEKWNSTEKSKYGERIDSEEDEKDFEDEDIDLSGFDDESEDEAQNKSIASSPDGNDGDSAESSPSPEPDEEENMVTTTEFNGMKIESKGQYSICPVCKKKIKSTFIFRHIKLHNQPTQKYPCPEKRCELVVNRINNLFRHLKVVHNSKKPYLCKYEGCKERFAKSSTLRSHLAVHRAEARKLQAEKEVSNEEENTKKFTCEFPGCGKEYGKRHHLKEHERKHTGDMRFSCEVCGKKFYMHAHMKRHLYSHTGIKPHVCRWKCGAIFASYGGRMKHERINHYKENPLQSECDICGRPFKNQQQLAKHRMTHLNPSERLEYRCSFCHIMLDTIKLKEKHEERHRDGETFECESCERTFKNEKNLSHHIKMHHSTHSKKSVKNQTSSKKEESQEIQIPGGEETEQTKQTKSTTHVHLCHICGPPKLFCLTSLRRHLARIHSQNYKCSREDCGRFFKEKSQLDAHEETHRMRECHLCGRKFQRKQNADIHLMGVHHLTTEDLEKLGRWNPRGDDPTKCPEYLVRSIRNTIKKKEKAGKSNTASIQSSTHEEADPDSNIDEITIKEEPLCPDEGSN